MSEVRFVYAEGLAISPASKEESIANAHAAIERLAPAELATA
jgi:FMN-dependent NADH-azoreductase